MCIAVLNTWILYMFNSCAEPLCNGKCNPGIEIINLVHLFYEAPLKTTIKLMNVNDVL